jgi:hypothetical protein
MGFSIKQIADGLQVSDSSYDLGTTPIPSTVKVKHEQFGPFVKTTLTLNNVAQAVVNGTEYQGTKIFDFAQGRILMLGVTATLQQKTTSAIASTINSGATGAIALGTATASNVSLSSTMVDLLPSTAFASSTTINVAGTAVSAALAASAHFDGTSTAKDVYLNTAYATTAEVDGDGTQTISGTIVMVYALLGDY